MTVELTETCLWQAHFEKTPTQLDGCEDWKRLRRFQTYFVVIFEAFLRAQRVIASASMPFPIFCLLFDSLANDHIPNTFSLGGLLELIARRMIEWRWHSDRESQRQCSDCHTVVLMGPYDEVPVMAVVC